MPACPTNTNALCLWFVYVCVHAPAQNNTFMDLLLNCALKAGEYDVEEWFVWVCVQAACLCVEIIF